MNDLVCCSLNVNIPMQNDTAERRLFNRAIEAIDYYCLVQLSTSTELVFLWLAQLAPLVSPSTDPNCTKSKSFYDNCGKSNSKMSGEVDSEELVIEEKLVMEEEFVTEEKLEKEKETKTEDLKGSE